MTASQNPSDGHAASPAEVVQQLVLSAWVSQGIAAAADLGVADALAAGPLSIDELAGRVGADADALGRLLRALIGTGIFAHGDDGRYELNPAADVLRSDAPVSIAAMARFVGSRQHREHWSLLTEAIRSGRSLVPQQRGKSFFDYLGDEPEFAQIFNDAMTGLSGASIGPVVAAYDFTGYRTIVDVGGGHGRLLAAILNAAPDAEGVLYDLPEVVAGAPGLLRENQVSERVRLAEGSFFDGVPAGGDAYVLKHIIHDWDDAQAVRILRNVRSAAAPGTAVLLIEGVVPEGEGGPIVKWVDLEMLVINDGRERTESQYRRLFEESGFRMVGVVDTASRFSVIEARAV
ncbi:O-methyltransferase [Mycobacterium bohemicum DSM 44277]|uniref:Hydroxyneurosporene methyltransferase n=2 Tax=Mycobacterium bohemicum TaxID=56425 RepID=A0A1X1R350_MYCBE|nr:acetylserotonin O-methyltransferase [Mycobacterium bohemicum]ORU98738.1 hydroxyneurosporene methyltransferase [Mycobacterium bohemicum]CPR12393.1 O-methyltransferase [Mycobacterium bohemicum DSM 44277]